MSLINRIIKIVLFIVVFTGQHLCAVEPAESPDSLSKELGEVTVTASTVLQKGNRTIVTITRQLRKGKMSAGEMLGDLPNFYYNHADRSVTFNNSSNIVVLVDSIEKPNADVFNLQHMRFDRMEIVRNPTGKYQGYDVLINFHTKENYEGYEGYAYHNNMLFFNKYDDATLEVDNEILSFAYTKNKWNIYARGNYYWGMGKWDIWSEKNICSMDWKRK